MKVCKIFWC